MEERKIEIWKSMFGGWAASESGSMLPEGRGDTPWEASAEACVQLGDDRRVIWESLPWTETRIALGIVMGVAELFGATKHAGRAIDAACYQQEMSDLQCSEYRSLTEVQRAELAASAAERMIGEVLMRPNMATLARAIDWLCVASDKFPEYEAMIPKLAKLHGAWSCPASWGVDTDGPYKDAAAALQDLSALNAQRGLCPDSWRNCLDGTVAG